MPNKPETYRAVMLSSTFTDLAAHRQEVMRALERLGLMPRVMDIFGARAEADLLAFSLNMVRDSAAYVGLIGHKYGHIPQDPLRNPDALSLTELEFNEAVRLERPILLFIMADDHPVTKADVERNPASMLKLDAFRTRATQMTADSGGERVYELFVSPEDLARKAAIAIGRLAAVLQRKEGETAPDMRPFHGPHDLERPRPPALRALPRYLASHEFIGRERELQALNVWAGEADPHPFLLINAMGGSGKSILAWHWVVEHAVAARDDWAGRFWFSFYERGATTAGFCREALSYMSGRPVADFAQIDASELSDRLIAALDRLPWLFVLDGLERLLVTYHRLDAAPMRDDDIDAADDPIADRDPRQSVRPEDDDLLRRLADVQRSKILATSRLMPKALIGPAGNLVPGVVSLLLHGLTPGDAEELLRSGGVRGDSKAIQPFLQAYSDCHPLVVGLLAGLVNDYLPDRGNFDAWLEDSGHGQALNLGELDLVQRRNHILEAAIAALTPAALQVLDTLALLMGGADYATLEGLNRYLSGRPRFSAAAPRDLAPTLRDLERRGLLLNDATERLFDLHPVVRAVTVGRMDQEQRETLGAAIVDYFSKRASMPRRFMSVRRSREGTWIAAAKYAPAIGAFAPVSADRASIYWPSATGEAELIRYFRALAADSPGSDPVITLFFADHVLTEEPDGLEDDPEAEPSESLIPDPLPPGWRSGAKSILLELRPRYEGANTIPEAVWYSHPGREDAVGEAGVELARSALADDTNALAVVIKNTHATLRDGLAPLREGYALAALGAIAETLEA